MAMEQIQAQAQANAQAQSQIEQAKAQSKIQVDKELLPIKAILDEKQKVSDDQREMERDERLELIKDGNVLHPTNLERFSILLREQMDESEAQQMLQEEQAMQQENTARQQQIAEQEGVPPERQGGEIPSPPGEEMVEQGAM